MNTTTIDRADNLQPPDATFLRTRERQGMKLLQPMKPQKGVTLGSQAGEQASPALVMAHLLGTALCIFSLQKFLPAQHAQAVPAQKF